jgi:hypothetical protein
MRQSICLILILLAVISIAVTGCNRSSSSNFVAASGGGNGGGNNGGDPGDPPGGPPGGGDPEDPVPPDIWIAADGVEILDPNSGNDGIAEPGEEVEFSITITNLGEEDGMVDIIDLNLDPSNSLIILTRQLDGIDVSDFNQITVPGEGAIVAGGTAQVDPSITTPAKVTLGPPELVASDPPTDPETVIDPKQIQGSGSINVTEGGGPPPPPPEEIHHARQPGSVLIYPFYRVEETVPDTAVSRDTLITVTNVNPDMELGPNGLPNGTIDIRFVYQDIHDDCLPFDQWERLTPYDTFSVMLSDYIPFHGLSEGWLYIHAVDPKTGESLDFDFLIGHAVYFDSDAMVFFSYNPLVYQAIPGHGLPTDLDLDENIDLNGFEYQAVGDNQMYARFIGTYTNAVDAMKTDLLLVNLTGGAFFQSSLKFLVFNDNEQAWSTSYDFWCWEVVPLDAFGELFTNEWLLNSNHDTDESLELFGNPEMETGWFRMDGDFAWSQAKSIDDPAFVSLLLEWYNGRLLASPPFDNGKQQDNATLWSVSVHGDNED